MLQTNATMTFASYEVQDGGIMLHFLCLYPGPGEPDDYYVLITDAELATLSNANQFKSFVITKLKRKLRADGIATRLDALIGQSVVI